MMNFIFSSFDVSELHDFQFSERLETWNLFTKWLCLEFIEENLVMVV